MRSRYGIHEPGRANFVTSTIVEWLPVFTSAPCCDIVVHSLQHCRQQKALRIHARVILDNHFHAILATPDLSGVLRDLKSFTAREILKQLSLERRTWLLDQLRYRRAAHKPNEYQVWQEGSHPQAILDDAMMQQKMEYLHNNPVKRGWVSSPEDWRYSSAHEWRGGAEPVLRCDAGFSVADEAKLRGERRSQAGAWEREIRVQCSTALHCGRRSQSQSAA